MGYNVQNTLSTDRELSLAYSIYLACREQHMVTYPESKGKDRTVQRIRPFTVGWSVLPEDGGYLDQPHRLMSFLEIFMHGDIEGFYLDKR